MLHSIEVGIRERRNNIHKPTTSGLYRPRVRLDKADKAEPSANNNVVEQIEYEI